MVSVLSPNLQGSQLVGKDRSGQAITTIFQQTTGSASDLQTCQDVSVMATQTGSTTDALQITVGGLPTLQ